LKYRLSTLYAWFVNSAKPIAGPRIAVFLRIETNVLIDAGNAMRPPIGRVTFRNVLIGPNPSAYAASR
jgi:hypothetical protein